MRFAALYLLIGACWAMFNAMGSGPAGEVMWQRMREDGTTRRPYFWAGMAASVIIWPLTMGFTVLALRGHFPELTDRIVVYFRRQFLDGPKWRAALTDPPPDWEAEYFAAVERMKGCAHTETRMVNLGGFARPDGSRLMGEKCVHCWAIRCAWSANSCPMDVYDENGNPKPYDGSDEPYEGDDAPG